MSKWIIFFLLAVLAIYLWSNILKGGPSARSIDSDCDAVVFTTATCPYCHKAKDLLNKEEVEWCEYDINESEGNYDLFKAHGGNGVPLAIIGNTKLSGFNEAKYLSAISKI